MGSSAVVVSGLTLGYAKYDPQFRKKIEDSIPYSNKVFDSLLGATAQRTDPKLPAINDSKDKSLESSLMRKKPIDSSPQLKTNPTKSTDKSIADNKPSDGSGSNKEPQQSPKKSDAVKDDKKEPEKEYSFGLTGSNTEDNNNDIGPPPDDTLQDLDLSIAKDKLAEELLNILPTDDERLKELQKRCNDIELEYQRKVCFILFDYRYSSEFNQSF